MEKSKTAIQEVKDLLIKFGFLKKEEEVQPEVKETFEEFLSVVLVDGTKLMVEGETLVEGAKVNVITDEAEVPAPDGEYELEDGTKVIIKDGLIETITPIETPAEEEEKPAEEMVDETPAEEEEKPVEEETTTDDAVELVDLMKTVIEKLGEFTTSMENQFKDVNTKIETLETNVEEFGKTPAGEPIKYEKTDKPEQKLNPLDARIQAVVGMKNKKQTN